MSAQIRAKFEMFKSNQKKVITVIFRLFTRGFSTVSAREKKSVSIFRASLFLGIASLLAVGSVPAQTVKGKQGITAKSIPPLVALTSPIRSVEGIDEYRLPNGLQVLLVPDDSKPTVTINLTYKVGSRHENYGETGMAHLLEHMLFKGTPKYPAVSAEFSKRGMRANGTTWTDRTNYFASFVSSPQSIDWYMRWLADSMTNSNIAKSDLGSEMTVVRNEMEMGENNNFRVLLQAVLGSAYNWHNYGKSTIGARADVENVDIERLKAFYRKYYQPDNATLIVSGKFDSDQIKKLLGEVFAKIPKAQRVQPLVSTVDPAQDGERSVVVRRSGGAPLIVAGFHIPPAGHPDTAAVMMLEEVLGDAPSGRLHKALVDSKQAVQTFAFGFRWQEPGIHFMGAQLAPNGDIAAARQVLLKTIDDVKTNPIAAEELERVRAKWLKNWELTFTNPEDVGVALSEAIAVGDWRLFFLWRDQVKNVTREQVQKVASSFHVLDNRTVATFVPTDKPERAPTPALFDVSPLVKDYKGGQAIARGEAFEATPSNIDKRTERVRLQPGVELALLPKKTRGEVVTATIRIGVGSIDKLQNLGYVASTAITSVDRGSKNKTRAQISDAFDQLKTEYSFGGSAFGMQIGLTTTRANMPKAIALALEVASTPTYPDEQIEELKGQWITSLRTAEKEPGDIGRNALARHINPHSKGDPRYVATFAEQIDMVQQIKATDLRAFHQRFVGASDVQISIVGDFDVAAVKSAIGQGLTGWTAAEAVVRVPYSNYKTQAAQLKLEVPDKQNAYFALRMPLSMVEGSAEHAAFLVADQIFSAGQNSRLWGRLREKEGLSYGVGSSLDLSAYEPLGLWIVGGIYAPQNLNRFLAGFNEELQKALKDGFTAQEATNAISAILQQRQLNRAQDAVVANSWISRMRRGQTWLESEKFDLLVKSVTAAQATEAFRKHVKPDQIATAVAGDFAKHKQ